MFACHQIVGPPPVICLYTLPIVVDEGTMIRRIGIGESQDWRGCCHMVVALGEWSSGRSDQMRRTRWCSIIRHDTTRRPKWVVRDVTGIRNGRRFCKRRGHFELPADMVRLLGKWWCPIEFMVIIVG